MGFYYSKVTTTKTRLYIWNYSYPIFYGFKAEPRALETYEKSLLGTKTDFSLHRCRNNAKMLVEANIGTYTKFLTLTYANASAGREQVVKDFSAFVRRFNRFYQTNLQYLYVQEQGKKNTKRWHVHAVLFHDAYLSGLQIKALWNHGHVKINAVDFVSNIGLYLVKYITKDTVELNKKGFISSHKLKKPIPERLTTPTVIDVTLADYTKHFTRKFKDAKGNEIELSGTLHEISLLK